MKTQFVLGLAGPPFGLKGFVKVRPFSGETSHFFRLQSVILQKGELQETYEIAEVVSHGDSLIMRFNGIDSPEEAKKLGGAEIIAGREFAAPLGEDEYYVEDLKGLSVLSQEGVFLGHIREFIEGGGGDLAEIEIPGGKRRLVPFRREFFGPPDFDSQSIVLLSEWILDET